SRLGCRKLGCSRLGSRLLFCGTLLRAGLLGGFFRCRRLGPLGGFLRRLLGLLRRFLRGLLRRFLRGFLLRRQKLFLVLFILLVFFILFAFSHRDPPAVAADQCLSSVSSRPPQARGQSISSILAADRLSPNREAQSCAPQELTYHRQSEPCIQYCPQQSCPA